MRRFKFYALFALSGVVYSCGGGGSGSAPSVNRGKTMVIHLLADPQGLNPLITTDAATTYIQNLIFDNLIVLDANTLEIRPQLAEGLPEISADKSSFIFKLNKKAKFSDGQAVTAKYIVFSFKALMNPLCETTNSRSELDAFKDCIQIDEYTVEFKVAKTGPMNLNRFAIHFQVLPKHIYDAKGLTDHYTCLEATDALKSGKPSDDLKARLQPFANLFNDEKFMREPGYVMGSGRYLFDQWKSGQMIRLVKNKNYWNAGTSNPFDQQSMDTIIYKTINDMESALVALKNGEIDFSHFFEPAQFKEAMTGGSFDQNFAKKNLPYPAYEYIGWNQNVKGHPEKNFFADKRVRWAMSYLIDVNAIVENLTYGTFHPITSMVYHERPEFNKDIKVILPNEEQAKALLNEAGWIDSDNDGILDRSWNGQKVNFEFTIYYRKGHSLRRNIALNLQQKFKKVGIVMTPQELESNYIRTRQEDHELEAWIAGWAYDSDEQDYYTLFHSSQIANNGYNYGSFYNPTADVIMEQIRQEWDETKRFDLHRQIQKLFYDEQPYTLLFGQSFLVGYNKRLEAKNFYKQRPCYDPPQFEVANGVKAN